MTRNCLNLLVDRFSEDELVSTLETHRREDFLPELDSVVWRNSRFDAYFEPLISLAEEEVEKDLPELSDSLYTEFHRSGNRTKFETVYFEKRRQISRAAIAYLRLENGDERRNRFGRSLVEKLEALSEDESWALPAHVKSPSGKDPLEIDLFGGETAGLMAELLLVFESLIPPSLADELRRRIEIQFFENYLNRHEDFWWTRTSNNWNAVCHQGVVGAALLLLEDTPKLARILAISCHYLRTFIDGFTDDGGCSEGPNYWSYGFGWFAKLNAQLESRSAGRLSLFEGNEKIRKIARFGPLMSLPGNGLVNFADCSSQGGLRPGLLTYLGERLQEPLCLELGIRSYETLLRGEIQLHRERSDFFAFSNLLLRDPGSLRVPEVGSASADVYLKDLGVVIAHGTGEGNPPWHFAAKAGHNDESHNHNDCGSFLLNVGEVPIIQEIGSPEYVKDYFDSARRYEFLAARTKGHSLAVINGQEQAAGVRFRSEVEGIEMGAGELSLRLNLTTAYPEEAGCREYLRTFRFAKNVPFLEVEETFVLTLVEDLESAVITAREVKLDEDRVTISHEGASVTIVPLDGTLIRGIERLSYRDHSGRVSFVQRISFCPRNMDTNSRIAYRIYPTENESFES